MRIIERKAGGEKSRCFLGVFEKENALCRK